MALPLPLPLRPSVAVRACIRWMAATWAAKGSAAAWGCADPLLMPVWEWWPWEEENWLDDMVWEEKGAVERENEAGERWGGCEEVVGELKAGLENESGVLCAGSE